MTVDVYVAWVAVFAVFVVGACLGAIVMAIFDLPGFGKAFRRGMTYQDVRVRTLERLNRKLQERLNRISNAMIGNARIWVLDRLAMELEVEAEILISEYGLDKKIRHGSVSPRARAIEREAEFRADALFLRRLEHDLGTLHVAVKGDTNRRGGRYDQSNWKGSRP